LAACGNTRAESSRSAVVPGVDGIAPERAADMIYAVISADRRVYSTQIVDRLVREQKVTIVPPATGTPQPLAASEDWKNVHGALPLPAQMLRMGAEHVQSRDLGVTYALLSPWPVNKQNRPRTPVETEGLAAITSEAGASLPRWSSPEELGGKRYLTAVYPDVAVAQACVDCHNAHPDSPRRDFELGDVMGGVVIRIEISPVVP
jgi:hypothetical protein